MSILAFGGGCTLRANSSGLDAQDRRFRNCVRVFTDFILEMGAVFANLVGIDRTAVFQVDDFRGSAGCAQE